MNRNTYTLLSLTLLIFLSACGQSETGNDSAENNASTAEHAAPGFDPEQSGQPQPEVTQPEVTQPSIALQQQSDDAGNTIYTAIKIDVGSAVSSNLSAKDNLIFDTDFFVFDVAADCTYTIKVDLTTEGAVPGDFNLSLRQKGARQDQEGNVTQEAAHDRTLVDDNDTSIEDFSDTNPEWLMITWTVPFSAPSTPVYIKFLSGAIQDTDYELAVETDDPKCNLSDESLPVRMENWGVGHSEMVVWDDTGAPEYLVEFKVNTVALKVVDQNQEPFDDSGHRDVSPISTVYADGDAVVPENGSGSVRYWHRLKEVEGNTPPVGQPFEMTIKDVYNGGELDPNKRRDCLNWTKNNCCAEGQCRINLNSYQLNDARFNHAVYTGDPRSYEQWDPSTWDKLDGSQVFEIKVFEKDSGDFVPLSVRGGNTVIADKSMNKQFTKSNGDAYYATPQPRDPEYCPLKEDAKVCGLTSELAYVAETGDSSTWTVKLKWDYRPDRSGLYDYEIYRAEDTGGDYKQLDWERLTTVTKKSNAGRLPAFGSQQWVDGSGGDISYPENGKTYAYAVVPRYFKYAGPDGQHTVYNSRSVYHNKLVNDIHAELGYIELFPPTATVNADHVLRGILIPATD